MARRRKKNGSQRVPATQWPVNVPVTPDNIAEYQKTHNLYVAESGYAVPILEDPDQEEWVQAGLGVASDPARLRTKIRELASRNATAKRVLDLYRYYILGGSPEVGLVPIDPEAEPTNKYTAAVNKRLSLKRKDLRLHLSLGELVKRLMRDGDLFIRRIKDINTGSTTFRFVDPEDVADKDGSELGGIVTDDSDVVSVREYILTRQEYDDQGILKGRKEYSRVTAEDMLHIKLDADSTEKRGRSRLLACLDALYKHRNMMINEVTLRQSQSAIVMVRKVHTGQSGMNRILDAAKATSSVPADQYAGQERNRAGTVVNTTKGVEIDFAHPDNNFSDAGPLLSCLLREVAQATGFTYEQVSCDTSQGNLASALVAESPVVQMINEEREFLATNLEKLWGWLLEDESVNYNNYEVQMVFPNVETEDRLKRAQSLNLAYMAKAVSSQEISRQFELDPIKMQQEIAAEFAEPAFQNSASKQNPTTDAKQTSSSGNAFAGGTNQGSDGNTGSTDVGKQGTKGV